MLPIRWRLTLYYVLTMLVVVALPVAVVTVALFFAVDESVRETARARALEAARVIETGGTLDEAAIARLSGDGIFIIARDGAGQVLAETTGMRSDANEIWPEPSDVRPQSAGGETVWRQALTSNRGVAGPVPRPWELGPGEGHIYAIPIVRADSSIRVVEAVKTYESAALRFFWVPALGIVAAVVLLLAIVGSYLMAWTALRPVNAIIRSARDITEGDLSKRLPVRSKRDELSRLARTFNDLLARLEIAFNLREQTLAQQRRFVADASHELRTPLTSILGYARMLRQWGLENPATAKEGLAAIEGEATRMNTLVEGLLSLARGDESAPVVPRDHDLREVTADAVQATRVATNGKVHLIYEPPATPVIAYFDRDRVQQAAGILLDNAVKYTPDGGTITVAVRANGGGGELAVTDTGIGIPAAHLPHIFDRFHRVDEARGVGGTGLGLAIARQIAEGHGGRIEVMSQPGEGSTFTLRLPPAGGPDRPRPAAPKRRSWFRRRRGGAARSGRRSARRPARK